MKKADYKIWLGNQFSITEAAITFTWITSIRDLIISIYQRLENHAAPENGWLGWNISAAAQNETFNLQVLGSDLLDAVDASLIGFSDVQRAQVGQGDGLGGLQGGAHRCPLYQVVVDAWNLAVDGPAGHYTHLQTFWHLASSKTQVSVKKGGGSATCNFVTVLILWRWKSKSKIKFAVFLKWWAGSGGKMIAIFNTGLNFIYNSMFEFKGTSHGEVFWRLFLSFFLPAKQCCCPGCRGNCPGGW